MQVNTTKKKLKETLLTPRFYTTNFEAMSKLDISHNQEEFEALLKEFKADYNQQHFIRDTEFDNSQKLFNKSVRSLFVEFLERSCTAEFSGFLLYKELSRRLKNSNPVLAECFLLMSRDEARHAGFLNKAMGDFDLSLDLGCLTKNRKYTFFPPKFIFYATYLSEKIGYWRYITIYRHLEKHPQYRIYHIFRFFENWCQDENRHGDFFAALLKSQPSLLNDWQSKLWCRFFLVSVFVTMYLNDCQRSNFYSAIGLDSRQYDMQVIRKTNESASRVFPVALNVDHPRFFRYLDLCASNNQMLLSIDTEYHNYIIRNMYKTLLYLKIVWLCFKLYMVPPVNSKSIWKTIK